MTDYSQFKTADAIPEASSMVETFRAIGYGIEAAVADLVDNSIAAKANTVWINFEFNGPKSWLSVKDDGRGMSNEELIQAMRPGSKNPLSDRSPQDLGRFGLGLKTASFSQCRKLTVLSKQDNLPPDFWTWDLDFISDVKEWKILRMIPFKERFLMLLDDLEAGTLVIWNDMDRLTGTLPSNQHASIAKFNEVMEQVKKHLSMVFHRFIGSNVQLYFQDRPVLPWDPFLSEYSQGQPEERLQSGSVLCKGYVLPHKSRISEEIYKVGEGPRGWNEQQGFYVYRNQRLLVGGDWLGLFRKEEHYKLARIRIDLPNTLDREWQIDIKKSVARPPHSVRDKLRAYANKVRSAAVEVYRHRGKSVRLLPGQQFVPLWIEHRRGDKWFYKINRDNPLVADTFVKAKTEPRSAIEQLIRLIEETIPSKSIYIKESEEADTLGRPFEGVDQGSIQKLMQEMFKQLIRDGKSSDEAKSIIAFIEPFNNFPHFLEFLS